MLRERNKDFFASKFVHWALHVFLNWVGNLEALEKAFDKSHVTASLSKVHQQMKDATIGCLATRLLGKLMTLRCLGTGKIVPIIPQVSPKILSSCRPLKRAKYNCYISLDPQTTAHQSKAVTHLSALFIFLLLKTKYQLGKQVVLTRCSNTYHPHSDHNDLPWNRLKVWRESSCGPRTSPNHPRENPWMVLWLSHF